uniref:Delta-like protein n=1 Tax=Anopheles dirus TaxID=7168 RepID=A0A182N5S3_9DIPT
MYNESYSISERLIDETSFSGVILPSHDWNTLDHIGKSARITYRVRVQCADNYYNTTCTTFCRPRNDQFGHYTCGKQGNKVCLPGWQGANCEKGKVCNQSVALRKTSNRHSGTMLSFAQDWATERLTNDSEQTNPTR